MKANRLAICAGLVACLSLGATGCGVGPMGDMVSGGIKLANGQFSALTANELIAVQGVVLSALGGDSEACSSVLTQQQAQALVDFFVANNLNSFEDLENFVRQAEQEPSVVQGLEELAAAFGISTEGEFDPSQLEQIFACVFGSDFSPPSGGGQQGE